MVETALLEKKSLIQRKKLLTAKVADCPEEQAENHADHDGAGEGKGDRPAAALPREITGQPAQGYVHPRKCNKNNANHDEKKAKRDEDAS
jgi:hypothetical protein